MKLHKKIIAGMKLNLSLLIILSSIFTETTFAAPQNIQAPNIGDLSITVADSGAIQLDQKVVSTFVPQLSSNPAGSGSFLSSNLGVCGLGFSSVVNATLISNTSTPTSIVTRINCKTSGGSSWADWVQTILYAGGNSAFIQWEIINTSGAPLSNINFFHVQSTAIDGGTQTFGFAQDAINQVGSRVVDTLNARILSFQSFMPTFARASKFSSTITGEVVSNNNLTSLIDPAPNSSNAFAMQWFKSDLQAGDKWALAGREILQRSPVVDEAYIIAPAEVEISPTSTISVPFVYVNGSAAGRSVGFDAISAMSGWGVSVTTPQIVAMNSETSIQVNLTSPATALDGEVNAVLLTATSNSLMNMEICPVIVKSTSVPTTPTPSPTPTIPPQLDVSIAYPFDTTGSSSPVIPGTAFPGSVVNLFINNVTVGSTTSDASGLWFITPAITLVKGNYELNSDALDPFGRMSKQASPFQLYMTGGAELDFEGDGLTDLATYVTLGSSVSYRVKLSSNGSSRVASIKGVVPAPADYDGDGTTDFAAIRRSGKSFLWTTLLSSNKSEIEQSLGAKGDTLISGCRFQSSLQSSFAAFRGNDLIFNDISNKSISQIQDILPANSSYLGCADINGDGIDELLTSSGNATQTISAIKLDKEKIQLGTTPRFTKAFVMKSPNDSQPILLLARSESASKRSLQPFSLVGGEIFSKIAVPKKLIVGSGLVLDDSGTLAVRGLFFQDLKLAKISGYLLSDLNTPHNIAAVSRNSRAVISQYSYKTR